MLIAIIGATLIGLLFIYLEFFAPGGILGALGGITLIASIALFFWQYGGALGAIIYLVLLIIFLILTIQLALWRIKKSKGKNTLFANQDQEGFQASSFDVSAIGKKGVTLTNLKPAGHITVEGKRYQAVSEGTYIPKGETVLVLRGEGARLIVRKETKHE